MTAEMKHNNNASGNNISPCAKWYCEVKDRLYDEEELLIFFQIHQCSEYCLQSMKNTKTNTNTKKGEKKKKKA